MLPKLVFTAIISLTAAGIAVQQLNTESTQKYGDVRVSQVLRLDEHVRLYCDIPELPPIIGENIPVCINGLKSASNPKDNLKLLIFLNDLLLSKNDKPEKIFLRDIQRGEQFCLIADIEIDGRNLCDIMVEKGLATKVIEVVQPTQQTSSTGNNSDRKTLQVGSSSVKGEYIASKSSKVFHWANCPHARRMDTAKAIYFVNPEDAAKSGRRPCKTCNPQ